MPKIVSIAVFFALSLIFFGCKKKSEIVEPENGWDLHTASGERPGPGYAWRLSTADESNKSAYFNTPGGNRQFYLKASDNYARVVTLTVIKRSETGANPTFRIYGHFQQCLLISNPVASSGNYTSSGVFQHDDKPESPKYSGLRWTPLLAENPVNSKATLTFTVHPDGDNANCTEGFIQVDLVTPAAINSTGSYMDGDFMYFVRNKNL